MWCASAGLLSRRCTPGSAASWTGARQGQPVVVDDRVRLGDEADSVKRCGKAHEHQYHQQAERDPDDVLLQSSSPGSVLLRTESQVLRKNSILTPASSITSWSFKECAWASRVLPFTTGKLAPSTWVIKKP